MSTLNKAIYICNMHWLTFWATGHFKELLYKNILFTNKGSLYSEVRWLTFLGYQKPF